MSELITVSFVALLIIYAACCITFDLISRGTFPCYHDDEFEIPEYN